MRQRREADEKEMTEKEEVVKRINNRRRARNTESDEEEQDVKGWSNDAALRQGNFQINGH